MAEHGHRQGQINCTELNSEALSWGMHAAVLAAAPVKLGGHSCSGAFSLSQNMGTEHGQDKNRSTSSSSGPGEAFMRRMNNLSLSGRTQAKIRIDEPGEAFMQCASAEH